MGHGSFHRVSTSPPLMDPVVSRRREEHRASGALVGRKQAGEESRSTSYTRAFTEGRLLHPRLLSASRIAPCERYRHARPPSPPQLPGLATSPRDSFWFSHHRIGCRLFRDWRGLQEPQGHPSGLGTARLIVPYRRNTRLQQSWQPHPRVLALGWREGTFETLAVSQAMSTMLVAWRFGKQ